MALYSPGLPSIRVAELEPFWLYEGIVTDETSAASTQIEESLILRVKTLGPSAPPAANGALDLYAMMSLISTYVDEAQTLGWITDAALHDALKAKAEAARAALMSTLAASTDTAPVKALLAEVMAIVDQAPAAKRKAEARDLIYFNAKYMLEHTPLYVPPQTINFILLPDSTTAPLNSPATLNLSFKTNLAAVPGFASRLRVVSGPNAGLIFPVRHLAQRDQWGRWGTLTDAAGQATFTYTSAMLGTDTIVAEIYGEGGMQAWLTSQPVEVTWKGGPDLTVGFFFPPVIKIRPGETTLEVRDTTRNGGDGPAPASVSRYYLSTSRVIDTAVDYYLGERAVPALAPGQQDKGAPVMVNLPAGLMPDTVYYVGVCVDADQTVAELDETNNCSTNGAGQVTMVMEKIKNRPPVCTAATARLKDPAAPEDAREHLTPADVAVENVTDPDGDVPVITVSAVTEIEEPEDHARRDHHGKDDAEVKNWLVAFSADDGKGGTCSGEAVLAVAEEGKKEEHHGGRPHEKEDRARRDKH